MRLTQEQIDAIIEAEASAEAEAERRQYASKGRRKSDRDGLSTKLLPALISGAVSAVAAVLAMVAQFDNARSDRLTTAYERIASLEEDRRRVRAERDEARDELGAYRAQKAAGFSTDALLHAYLDALDLPAWLKEQKNDGAVRVVWTNPAHEFAYGLDRQYMLGKTDPEIYGPEVGGEYLTNDLRIIASRDFEAYIEHGKSVTGVDELSAVYKFYVPSPDGRKLIAGIQIDLDDLLALRDATTTE